MEFWSAIKKNLWIFFQKYGLIRKIEPFHLIMKHNIIQMTIFQYIFDCLGKRSIRSITKIVAFGAQKIQSASLRSRCTYNEWLFGADIGKVASIGHFSSKMIKELPLRSMASVTMLCSTNFCFQKLKRMTFGFNYFLWEAVKDKFYANHPETILLFFQNISE